MTQRITQCHYDLSHTGLHHQMSLQGGPSVLGMSSFLNKLYWFGVVVFCRLGVQLVWQLGISALGMLGCLHFSIGNAVLV